MIKVTEMVDKAQKLFDICEDGCGSQLSIKQLVTHIAKLESEAERLKKDGKRMEWLSQFVADLDENGMSSLRNIVDIAMVFSRERDKCDKTTVPGHSGKSSGVGVF